MATSKPMSKSDAYATVRKDSELTSKNLKSIETISKTHGTPKTAYSYIPEGWRFAGGEAPSGFYWIYKWNNEGTKITLALYNHEKWKSKKEKKMTKKKSTKKNVKKEKPSKVSVGSYTMPAHTVPSHKVRAHRCKGKYVGKQIRPSYKVKSHTVSAYKRKYPRK